MQVKLCFYETKPLSALFPSDGRARAEGYVRLSAPPANLNGGGRLVGSER